MRDHGVVRMKNQILQRRPFFILQRYSLDVVGLAVVVVEVVGTVTGAEVVSTGVAGSEYGRVL